MQGNDFPASMEFSHNRVESWNLYKLNPGIISSKVNFLQKKLFITYLEKTTSLKKIVGLLDSIGYEPLLNLEDKKEEK